MSVLTDRPAPGWHTPVPAGHPAASLLSARAVRSRCSIVMAQVEGGRSPFFTWHPEHLPLCAEYVAQTIRLNYPDLNVPYHARWRHFEAGGVDRWGALKARAGLDGDPIEAARVAVDLVIPSVLLDAGAGPDWRYLDIPNSQRLPRSEGLGVASLALFASGALSSDAGRPLRCDMVWSRAASALGAALAAGELAEEALSDEVVCEDWSLWSGVASCSAKPGLARTELVVFGNSAHWEGDLAIAHGVLDDQPRLQRVTRRAVRPSAGEAAANPRARSAVLRVAERLPDPQAVVPGDSA